MAGPRLQEWYRSEVLPGLQRELGLPNPMRVPRLEKIVVNMGVGDAVRDAKLLDAAVADLAIITGQKPAITRARKSIAAFKLRAGMSIGAKVTLRGARMWEFLDRLLATALPRIRDFRGLDPEGFDGGGNYSIGVTEQFGQRPPDGNDRGHHFAQQKARSRHQLPGADNRHQNNDAQPRDRAEPRLAGRRRPSRQVPGLSHRSIRSVPMKNNTLTRITKQIAA